MAPMTRHSQSHTRASRPAPQTFFRVSNGLKDPVSHSESLIPGTASKLQHPLDPTTGNVHEDLRPVMNMAERIGREVEHFAETLDTWNERRQKSENRVIALSLLTEYKKIADEAVENLRKQHGSERSQRERNVWNYRARNLKNNFNRNKDAEEIDRKFPRTPAIKDLERWQQESDTWELLRIILSGDAFSHHLHGDLENLTNAPIDESENLWEDFLAQNLLAKERFLITKWLESTAEHTGNDLAIMAEQLEERAGRSAGTWSHGLLDTREQIKGEKRLRPWNMSKATPEGPLVSEPSRNRRTVSTLDPDSKSREERALVDSDDFFERSLWLACWEMLRRGRPFSEVREWCSDRHENWRSISLGLTAKGEKRALSQQGIFNHALWRRTCIMASKNSQASEYERAVYGLLGGSSSPVEPICRSWEDLLYAYSQALLAEGFENYLRTHYPSRFPEALHRLPTEDTPNHGGGMGADALSLALIEEELHNDYAEREAKTPMKMIQGSFISHEPMNLVIRLATALFDLESRGGQVFLSKNGSTALSLQNSIMGFATDPDALRVMAHIVLILQDLDPDYLFDSPDRMQAADSIVVGYIEVLKKARKLELIPLYASRLQRIRPETIVGRALPIIESAGERRGYVRLLKTSPLDILSVLKAQHEWLLPGSNMIEDRNQRFTLDLLEPKDSPPWPGQRIKSVFYQNEMDAQELDVISSLEWFLLIDGHWVETFKILTKALKILLTKGRIAAAINLCERLPTKTVSEVKTGSIFGCGIDIWSEESAEDLLNTRNANQFGGSAIRHSSPEAQLKLFAALKSQSKTYRDLEILVNALKALHDWRAVEDKAIEPEPGTTRFQGSNDDDVQRAYEDVFSYMQLLLKGDWLTDSSDVSEAEQHQLIRNTYLPPMILAYNGVLCIAAQIFGRDLFLQSMELANIVGSNAHDIKGTTQGSELAAAFLELGLLETLVTSIALASKMMLQCNEQALKIKGKKPKKRGRNGETLTIWDPNALMCPVDES